MEKKYELTDETIHVHEFTAYRIRALKDFGDVKKGDLGGYVKSEDNLSQNGDCWIYDNAVVAGKAQVRDNAKVKDSSVVFQNAIVEDHAIISGESNIRGSARIYEHAIVNEKASVYGSARIHGHAHVYGNAKVKGRSLVCDFADVYGKAYIDDDANIRGESKVFESATVYGHGYTRGHSSIHGDCTICGYADINDNADISELAIVRGNSCIFGNAFIKGKHNCTVVDGNARIDRDAYITSDRDWASVDSFGSYNRSTTFFRCTDGKVRVRCGCFYGTISQFKKRVRKTHKRNKFAKEYLLVAKLMKRRFKHVKKG